MQISLVTLHALLAHHFKALPSHIQGTLWVWERVTKNIMLCGTTSEMICCWFSEKLCRTKWNSLLNVKKEAFCHESSSFARARRRPTTRGIAMLGEWRGSRHPRLPVSMMVISNTLRWLLHPPHQALSHPAPSLILIGKVCIACDMFHPHTPSLLHSTAVVWMGKTTNYRVVVY